MTKKIFAIIIATLICVSFVFSASAYTQQQADYAGELSSVEVEENVNTDESAQAQAEKDGVSIIWIPISLGIGLLIGFLIINSMASKNKSVKMQKNATVYTRPGSMIITGSADNFLYNNIERREKPKQTENKQN